MSTNIEIKPTAEPELRRTLTLPLLVLYGLGTTIGAGIYVLVGAAAGRAGLYAPMAFIAAAIAILPTTISYSELVGRFPVSAGEAAYVRAGFNSKHLSAITGALLIISGIVASATIAIGCAGYIREFVEIPQSLLVVIVIATMGAVAAWGILESVLLAALFTVIEAGGLIFLVSIGFWQGDDIVVRIPQTLPPIDDLAVWFSISNASLLAVFAYIGFEDMVNVAEETKNPRRTMPWAIFITLIITTILYTAVTIVAVLSVDAAELAASDAPLSLVYERLTGGSAVTIGAIAVFATLNTMLVQYIMASRVIFGMAGQGTMPAALGHVNPLTRTPLRATAVVVLLSLTAALIIPLEQLAEITSTFVLIIWALANIALILLKLRGEAAPEGSFVVPLWVPFVGVFTSGCLIAISIIG